MSKIVISPSPANQLIVEEEGASVVLTIPASPSLTFSATGPQGPIGTGIPEGGNSGDLLVRTASGTSWTTEPTVDSLQIDITASGAIAPGQLRWNDREHTLDLGQLRGVVNQIGQENTMVALNTSALTIGDGRPVMFTGTDAATSHPAIGPMIADGSVPGRLFFGVTTEQIAPGDEGYVTAWGKVRNIDTSAFANEALLYADPANPGEWTDIEPSPPAIKTAVAAVINSHPTEGVLLVRATIGQDLSECHDVNVDSANNGEVLAWNEDGQYWNPTALPNVAPRSITIAEPIVNDSFTLFRTSQSTTITSAVALVAGITPAVGYEVRYASNRTASGTVAISPTIATNTTVGSGATVQNMPIPSGSYVWVNVTSVSGVPSEFNLSLSF